MAMDDVMPSSDPRTKPRFARWFAEHLPNVGDRVHHWEWQCTSIYGDYYEVCHGWGTVVRRLGPTSSFCQVLFDEPPRGRENPCIVWNSSVVDREPGRCCVWRITPPTTGTEKEMAS